MTKKYDAIIIGAGVIGAPIAYELVQDGLQDHERGQAAPMPARDPLRVPAPSSGPTTPPKTVWPLPTKDSSTGWTGRTTWTTSKDEKGLAKYHEHRLFADQIPGPQMAKRQKALRCRGRQYKGADQRRDPGDGPGARPARVLAGQTPGRPGLSGKSPPRCSKAPCSARRAAT
jgi:hypothetical protein